MKIPKGLIPYCALSMGFSMMSRPFSFYYVKVFLNEYHVPESWFHFSQLLYMIWNAVNDPLFAVLQDNTNFVITRTRREGILYSAPFFALSFLIPWFKFGDGGWVEGVHLIIALCLYDTMFTFVGLLFCCLFTEISSQQEDRLTLTQFSHVASLIGSQTVFLIEYNSDSLHNFGAFQMTTVFIAICSCLLMVYAGIHSHTKYDLQAKKTPSDDKEDSKLMTDQPPEIQDSFWRKSWQIFKEPNFISFVIVNFFQCFHAAYLSGFTAIFCDSLVPTSQVPLAVRSTFYGLTGTMGGLLVIFGTPFVGRVGYFRAIRYNFVWKVFGGLAMYFILGPSNPWLLMLFILLDTTFASATFSLFNMPLADIADNDKEKYNRRHPISSTVFGNNALVTKPAQSIAPMLIVAVLNRYGYEQLKTGALPGFETHVIKNVMFQIICFTPVVLGILQYFVWSQFTIYRRTERTVHDYEI